MRRRTDVETIELPPAWAAVIDSRTLDLIRRSCYDLNIVESIARSCYLQGLLDGAQVAAERPDLVDTLRKGI